jgi:hypothetical protein
MEYVGVGVRVGFWVGELVAVRAVVRVGVRVVVLVGVCVFAAGIVGCTTGESAGISVIIDISGYIGDGVKSSCCELHATTRKRKNWQSSNKSRANPGGCKNLFIFTKPKVGYYDINQNETLFQG